MTLILSLGCKGVDALKAKTSTPGGIPHLSFKFQWRKTSSVILQHLGGIALHMGFQETYYCGDTCAAHAGLCARTHSGANTMLRVISCVSQTIDVRMRWAPQHT